jgi:hypothetical protein
MPWSTQLASRSVSFSFVPSGRRVVLAVRMLQDMNQALDPVPHVDDRAIGTIIVRGADIKPPGWVVILRSWIWEGAEAPGAGDLPFPDSTFAQPAPESLDLATEPNPSATPG